ncbi:MAG: dephospho-CoA kinase [Pseudomonadota bacterium]
MAYVLGLTGSIGMGKSTTAAMFAAAGVPVWDADQAVHELYKSDASLINEVEVLVPGSTSETGVDRSKLKEVIAKDPPVLKQIEAAVAPYVAASRERFVQNAGSDILLIDHPLLFESGTDKLCDGVVVVTIDAETQRERVLERGTMTADMLATILAKQMPDADKQARADYLVVTTSPEAARKQVQEIIRKIRSRHFA